MLPHESTSSSSFSSSSFLPSSATSSSVEITDSEPEAIIKVEDEIQFNSAGEDEFEFDVRVKVEEELDPEKEEDVFQHLSQLLNEPDDDRINKNGTVCDPQNVDVEMMFELKEEEEEEDVRMDEGVLSESDSSTQNLVTYTNHEYHLKAHLRTHKSSSIKSLSSPKKKKIFPCHLCSVTTCKKYNLKQHMLNVHSSPFKCPESGCDYKAKKTRKSDIRIHLEDRHFKSRQEIETILKDIVSSSSSSFLPSTSANQVVQPKQKPVVSKSESPTQKLITTTTNPTSTNLTSPILVSTQSNCANFPDQQKMFYKVYKCGYCDYKTNHEYHLKAHLRTHKSPKSSSPKKKKIFPCHLCSVTTTTKPNLRKHIQNIHEGKRRLFKCCELGCKYSNTKKQRLKLHEFSRHGKREKDLEIFTCSHCPYKTLDKSNLRQHEKNVHVRLFEFACDLCPFKTSRKVDFQKHVDCVHLNLRPYKCPEAGCDYAAKEYVAFKEHMKRCHKKSQEEVKNMWKTVSSNCNNSSVAQIQIQPESEPESKLSIKATTKIPVSSQNVQTKVESNLKAEVKSCTISYHCKNCEFYTQEQKQLAAHLYNQHNLPRVQLQLLN